MRYLLVLIWILMTMTPVCAEEDGGRAGSFLSYGGSAREVAMGSNLCAVPGDASALLWNPAGLALLETSQASVTHGLISEDRSRNYLTYAMPLGRITLGTGWLHAGTDGIQNRSDTGQLLGDFVDSESVFLLGAAAQVYTSQRLDLMLGGTFRYFRHSLFEYTGTGTGLDFGVTAQLAGGWQIQRVVLAASMHNMGADISWDTESEHADSVPSTLHTGISLQLVPFDILATGSLTRSDELDTRLHLGLEVPVQILVVRMGLDDGDFAAGFGVPLQTGKYELKLDYGYRNDEIADSLLHFFSVSILF